MGRKEPPFTYTSASLIEAEQHVLAATARVDEQQRRVYSLRAQERDIEAAEKLLADLRSTLAIMIEHRDWIITRKYRTDSSAASQGGADSN